ncbi:conserved protein of unknown function [Modestobacter italicus]|uniref:Uncharacterized protein n=1 Tax=Modestobacter italicus (strain DSM 44449 / CECT 9708 / BC 501) TaxID=2732864 RepID=I4F5C3_MODI5|nr:conserved protein of unknown function [Modestobacter marinus]
MTWPEQLALAFGVVYINPMHNVVHILVGVAGIALSGTLGVPAPTAGCSPSATARPSSTG